MTDERREEPISRTPEEQRVAEDIQRLGEPRMTEDFRARLRAQFVAGEIPENEHPAEVIEPPPSLWKRWAAPAVALAAAASVALWFLVPREEYHFAFTGSMGDGELWVCGMHMDPADPEPIDAMLHAGTSLETRGNMQADFHLPGRLVLQLGPNSVTQVPAWPPPANGTALSVQQGEVRFATGKEFGSTLRIGSAIAEVLVTGTTFAVISAADSSCVCVFEGEVEMTDADGARHRVPAGKRRSVYRDRAPLVEDILPMESMKLEALKEAAEGP